MRLILETWRYLTWKARIHLSYRLSWIQIQILYCINNLQCHGLWWQEEAGHQQPWFWPSFGRIFRLQDQKVESKHRYDLTHWGGDKMVAIFQTTFSNTFSWMKMYQFRLKISLKFVPKSPINNIPALVHIMAWRRPGHKPLSEPMMVSLLTHICITWPQW